MVTLAFGSLHRLDKNRCRAELRGDKSDDAFTHRSRAHVLQKDPQDIG
ncbi:hypothetical protein AFAE65S_00415 [Alcaligenes phenolicus]